ncbi:MAG: endonuclease/exonuclease/phosphatase family protein [Paracoccaceae bacterium]
MRILAALAAIFLSAVSVGAETVRIATFNAGLTKPGPGLLVEALRRDDDPQLRGVVNILREIRPAIVLINGFDFDFAGVAAEMFRDELAAAGLDYPYHFAGPVNSGVQSGWDLDGDGKLAGPTDAYGFGRFPGQEGMLLLSVFPLADSGIRSFRTFRWADLPDALLPVNSDGSPFPSEGAQSVMRLSSKSHWDVPVRLPGGMRLHLFASHATPPVFDGPEDMNGRRNHDEIAFWRHYVNGRAFVDDAGTGAARADEPFVILGDLNSDPADGDSLRRAVAGLLADPLVQDPSPASRGGAEAAAEQAGANRKHTGRPELDTADWDDEAGPGNLRVDYVLPSRGLPVAAAGVFWPDKADPLRALIADGGPRRTRHRLVWVDIAIP